MIKKQSLFMYISMYLFRYLTVIINYIIDVTLID